MNYTPAFNTDVQIVEQRPKMVNTMHVPYFDWDYPFDDPELWSSYCSNQEQRDAMRDRIKAMLKTIEENPDSCRAGSHDFTYPVIGFGMASAWPYWKPRPTVIVMGHLGAEYIDWQSLKTVRVVDPSPYGDVKS